MTPEKQLMNQLVELAKEGVAKVVSGQLDRYETAGISADQMSDLLCEHGAESCDELDYNGWSYDYWDYYELDGKVYCIAGSGYYGGVSISLDRERSNKSCI